MREIKLAATVNVKVNMGIARRVLPVKRAVWDIAYRMIKNARDVLRVKKLVTAFV